MNGKTLLLTALALFAIFLLTRNLLIVKQIKKSVRAEPASNEPKIIFKQTTIKTTTTHEPTIAEKLKDLLHCKDRELYLEKLQYGEYWLIRNMFIGKISKNVACAETLTYTTNGDYTFFESLPVVIKSWLAPISFALYAPGFDFDKTMESIQYLRNCIPESQLIQDYVSFHIYFQRQHMPEYVPYDENEALKWNYTCDEPPTYENVNRAELYKTQANLTYPINVGRNIARKAANTHFIFACDIELIPSPNLATQFLEMIANNISILHGNNGKRVFPLPVFEVDKAAKIPRTKTELKQMLATKQAIPFHAMICKICHLVPSQMHWLNATDGDQLTITAISKREGKFRFWEPFYISDNKEPIFDERVTWEGQSNKRIQNFAMCLLGYEYLILHPAFLTHMPGIKYVDRKRMAYVPEMNKLIKEKIQPEYRILYGKNSKCHT